MAQPVTSWRLAAALVAMWLMAGSVARAQEPPVPVSAPAPAAATASEERPPAPQIAPLPADPAATGPDTYILLDANGQPYRMLNLRYEDFLAAWQAMQAGQLQPAPVANTPRFVLARLSLRGTVEPTHAQVTVEYEFTLAQSGRIALPLGLASAVLTDAPADAAAPGRQLRYDEAGGGYVLEVAAQGGETVRLALACRLPLRREGSRVSLDLNLPRALASDLELAGADLHQANLSGSGVLSAEASEDGQTLLKVTGLAGDAILRWEQANGNREQLESVLSSEGEIEIAIDGRSVRTTARLQVESFSGSFQRFRVRLPAGARLVQRVPNAEIDRVTTVTTAAADTPGQVLEVTLRDETTGPVPLELQTEQPLGLSGGDDLATLSGFEVLEAVRQFGKISLSINPRLQVRWESSTGVQQIAASELPAASPTSSPVAAFEYFRQPWQIALRVAPRQPRALTRPRYQLRFDRDRLVLRTTAAYEISGGLALPFQFELAGWQVTADPITARGLENTDSVVWNQDGTFELPFARPIGQQVELTFTATRELEGLSGTGATTIAVPLPYPKQFDGLTVDTSELEVVIDDSLQVVPNAEAIVGLAPQPVSLDARASDAATSPIDLYYRGYQIDPVFAATVSRRPREIAVETQVTVSSTSTSTELVSDFDYQVRHQAVESLRVAVPSRWALEPSLRLRQFTLNGGAGDTTGESLAFTTTPADSPAEPMTELVIALPRPQVGRFRLQLTCELPSAAVLGVDGTSVWLALPRPIEGQWQSERVDIAARGPAKWELTTESNDAWVSANNEESAVPQRFLAQLPGASEISLTVKQSAVQATDRPIVDRVWIQSWFAQQRWQQRVAMAVRSTGRSLRIELPIGIAGDQVEVLVDAVPAAVVARGAQLEITLPRVSDNRRVVELRYRLPRQFGWFGAIRVDTPRVAGSDELVDAYWQLVLPANQVYLPGSCQLSEAHDRAWQLGAWYASPLLDTKALGKWIGAPPRSIPDRASRVYLFSSLGWPAPLTFTAARYELVVLLTSLAVLALVFVALAVSWYRRPWILWLGLPLLLVVVSWSPAWAVVVGRAGLLGVAAGALAVLLSTLLRTGAPEAGGTATYSRNSTIAHARALRDTSSIAAAEHVSSNAPTISVQLPDPQA